MSAKAKAPSGPDLTTGVAVSRLGAADQLLGHVGDEDVLVVQVDGQILAIGATCTHYRGPLAEGLVVGDTVRCPWHHACFSLRTGEAVRAPALDPVACWRVERTGDRFVVKEKLSGPDLPRPADPPAAGPASIVIAGGGAAAIAAADVLRREGYRNAITMVSADADAPYDRPNLSKDYLAGKAPEDWMPLRDEQYYADQGIRLMLKTRLTALDTARRSVALDDGTSLSYGALLIATGADPVRLKVAGTDHARVHYLRSFADSRAIVAALSTGARVVVVGASFIGLEVAASLRMRGIETHVVAPEARPMERIMGPDVAEFIKALHEAQGVVFHLGQTVESIDGRAVRLASGTSLDADVIVVGIGVKPAIDFAERAGLSIDQGIAVDEYLETSAPGVFAAGDVARWPDPHTGERIRVEHWVVALRQGQTAARNMLGRRVRFDAVPFFWSQHYDVTINYAGHASRWDAIDRTGDLQSHDCTLTFRRNGRPLAVATVGRDRENLLGELELERSTA
jgi:NADPH-dependent 2,4-dienoyl-CoA reductase/sulfur reductase-like enzyme/nitrite reductase/ring-hydroxylating ferredoxin subunit